MKDDFFDMKTESLMARHVFKFLECWLSDSDFLEKERS